MNSWDNEYSEIGNKAPVVDQSIITKNSVCGVGISNMIRRSSNTGNDIIPGTDEKCYDIYPGEPVFHFRGDDFDETPCFSSLNGILTDKTENSDQIEESLCFSGLPMTPAKFSGSYTASERDIALMVGGSTDILNHGKKNILPGMRIRFKIPFFSKQLGTKPDRNWLENNKLHKNKNDKLKPFLEPFDASELRSITETNRMTMVTMLNKADTYPLENFLTIKKTNTDNTEMGVSLLRFFVDGLNFVRILMDEGILAILSPSNAQFLDNNFNPPYNSNTNNNTIHQPHALNTNCYELTKKKGDDFNWLMSYLQVREGKINGTDMTSDKVVRKKLAKKLFHSSLSSLNKKIPNTSISSVSTSNYDDGKKINDILNNTGSSNDSFIMKKLFNEMDKIIGTALSPAKPGKAFNISLHSTS